MRNLILAAFLLLAITSCQKPKTILWTSTTDNDRWKINEMLAFSNTNSDAKVDFVINTSNTKQVIDGFGGCFNELGWDALGIVTKAEKQAILTNLFDSISGCKFNICRMPIGANDYSVDWYSFDETPNDYLLKDFSIDRDRVRLIPYIHAAQELNPNLKIWASPWSPPSWMKTNRNYACRADENVNDLKKDQEGAEMTTLFRMEDSVLTAYARYFEKFVENYATENIEISAVHVQNELNSCQNFPSCIWYPNDMATFIGKYLGPQLEKSGLKTQIWLGTIERPQPERVDSILQNPEAKQYLTGVGFQWAGKGAIAHVAANYPEMKLMQTETECGDGSNDWKAAEHTFELMHHYFTNGANAYMYWNMVLDETGKSQWGWKQNSMISIDKASKTITYNPEFYLMKHFSFYIKPEAKRADVEGDNGNCLAFVNKNGEVVVEIYNNEQSEKTFYLSINGKIFSANTAAKSFNTFVIQAEII